MATWSVLSRALWDPSRVVNWRTLWNAYLFRFNTQAFNYATYFPGHIIKENAFAKLIQYKDVNCTLFRDGRMNVHGIEDDSTARQLYEEFNKQLK